MCFKAKMNVRTKDGKEVVINSDTGWKCAVSNSENLSEVTNWGNNGGERIDARAYLADWNRVKFDDSAWENPVTVDCAVKLSSHILVEPTRVIETYKPAAITGDGTFRIEFAKNFTGWFKIEMSGLSAGDTVTILTADDEKTVCDFNQRNIYIAKGTDRESFCNRFNYTGGRFFTVEGLKKKPEPADVTAYALTTDLKQTGHFTSSNELYNKIYELDLWTFRAATLEGFTMDCPHRERCGYGETTITSAWGTGFPIYEAGALYHKVLLDLIDAQDENGFVHNTAPQSPSPHYGGPMFGCAGLNVAAEHYLNFADAQILELIYPSAKKWLEFLNTHTVDGLLVPYDKHKGKFLGEWAAPNGRTEYGDSPQSKYFNNCVYAMNLADFIGFAKMLNRLDDVAFYSQRLDSLKRRIHEEYYNAETGTYSDGNQAQQAFALLTGITPENLKPAVVARLHRELTETHPYFDVGSAGLPVLLPYLINHPEEGEATAKILAKTDCPGYGYFIKRGETTMPEYWEVDVPSRIHTCYVGIASWFIKGLCGIQPDAGNTGYQSFIIRPIIVPEVDFAEASVESPYGKIVSRWERKNNQTILSVTVPPNTSATIHIPSTNPKRITENGNPPEKIEGITLKGVENGYTAVNAVSGKYRFVVVAGQ
jgi:alpha-L-rhamnosidase